MQRFILNVAPPRSTHQSTARAIIRNGKPAVITNWKGKRIKKAFVSLVAPHAPTKPYDGALEVKLHFGFPWRKSEPKYRKAKGSLPCHVKPDLDNLAKFFLDSMESAGFFLSDSQVARLALSKDWCSNPHIAVEISSCV